jgi:phage-related baseplate assembly protein
MSLIDLDNLPAPTILEALDFEALQADFMARFVAYWADARAADPTLPEYDVQNLETDPIVVVSQPFSYVRLLDRARVNDALKAVLLPYAADTDLDNLVARNGVVRIAGETDDQLARRYLLSFERGASGSAANYLFHAYSVAPGMLDAKVNGQAIHGRRGDVDIVIATALPDDHEEAPGPDPDALADVLAAVSSSRVKPEATGVSVIEAERIEFSVGITITVDTNNCRVLATEHAKARIEAACAARAFIGASLPADYITGAAYGADIIDVDAPGLTDIVATRYQLPVLTGVTITAV